MKNNKIIRFVQSLVLLPTLTMSAPFGDLPKYIRMADAGQVVIEAKLNTLKEQAQAIDAYFKERGMPLAGTGMAMAEAALENGLDWRLIPAIAVRESTGGKFECKKADFNPFGWGSCKIDFDSINHAIEIIAKNLGGNNPKTARHYDNKTTLQILRAYNPPSIVPRYAEQVLSIMNAFGSAELGATANS